MHLLWAELGLTDELLQLCRTVAAVLRKGGLGVGVSMRGEEGRRMAKLGVISGECK